MSDISLTDEDKFALPRFKDEFPYDYLYDQLVDAVAKAQLRKIADFIGGVFSEKKWEELKKEIE